MRAQLFFEKPSRLESAGGQSMRKFCNRDKCLFLVTESLLFGEFSYLKKKRYISLYRSNGQVLIQSLSKITF